MNYPVLVIAALLFVAGCGQKDQKPGNRTAEDTRAGSSAASQRFFPLADFLKSEINYVDSLPVGIMKYRTAGTKKDSSYIKPDEFHVLAAEFMAPEFNDSVFARSFRETSMYDRNTNTASFMYTPNSAETTVKRVDIVTGKGNVYDEVKSIYIEKLIADSAKELRKKLFWRPRRNFQIISFRADSTGKTTTELVKVVWDNRE